jgi:predicted phage terminase large subunit-like protein
MVTAGVGGPITGKGADLLIIDDPIKNDEEARSSSFREKQWDWWQSVASTRIRPGGLFVIIQTRWHRDDLTGRILRQAVSTGQRWRQIVFPALAEGNDALGRAPGEALWPEMYSREKLLRVKEGKTTYYWRALYQQDPQAEGGTEWPESWFGPNIWFNEWPTVECLRVVALDPSKGKDSKFGDYSAFVKVMRNDGLLYVDAEMGRWNTSEIVQRAADIQRKFKPHVFGIEVNQFQSLLAEQIEMECSSRGLILPLSTIENYENKVVRIRTLTPLLAKGLLRFKGDSPGARLLVDQMRDFPLADHDDGCDSLEMSVRLMCNLLRRQNEEPLEEIVYA